MEQTQTKNYRAENAAARRQREEAAPFGVSIIIPAYNPGEFLRQAIESVHAQTYTNWELIVIDDNSSEDLSWVSRDFPRTRYIRQSHGGVSVARNNGILHTSAPLISFMDQDDLWRPQKLEHQVAALHRVLDAAVCFCDLEVINADVKFADMRNSEKAETLTAKEIVVLDGAKKSAKNAGELSNVHRSIQFFSSQFIVPSTVMLRRSALSTSGLLDPFIPFSGDYDLLIKLGARHKIIRVPAADVLYRKHANNFSDQYQVGRQEVSALIARYRAYAKAQGDRKLEKGVAKLFNRPRHVYAAQAFDNARRSLRKRDYQNFTRHFARAVWFSPIFVGGSITRGFLSKRQK